MASFLRSGGLVTLAVLCGCFPRRSEDKEIEPAAVTELQLEAAWEIDYPGALEPSGLYFDGTRFLTVSDDHDSLVFELMIGEKEVEAVHYRTFDPPARGMDFEGISGDMEGNLYLLSERYSGVLAVYPNSQAEWVGGPLSARLEDSGLLQKRNAGFEGLTRDEAGNFLILAEREPRGVVSLSSDGEDMTAQLIEDTPFWSELPAWRNLDFSALSNDGERVFALFRNAHLVVELKKGIDGWEVADSAWSYAHVETAKAYGYENSTFGQAEGLVVIGDTVWIILDHNHNPRMKDRRNRKAQLWKLRMP